MLWLVATVLMMIMLFGLVVWRIVMPKPHPEADEQYNQAASNAQRIASLSMVGVGLVWVLATMFSAWTTVDVGKVGVVKTFGHLDGHLGPGVHLVKPWADVISFDTRVKTLHFSGDKSENTAISAFSRETQNVQVKATLNINVSPKDVDTLYRQIGTDYTALIPSRVNQVVKDEVVKYAAVDLAPNREQLRSAVRERLRSELAPFSINVLDVNIDNISFSPQFEAAIEAKQEATQATLKAQQLVQTAHQNALAAVETAKGQADVVRQAADGQADANRSLNASLSPEVIQYLGIQKLNPNVQMMIVPQGQNTFFQLPSAKPAP